MHKNNVKTTQYAKVSYQRDLVISFRIRTRDFIIVVAVLLAGIWVVDEFKNSTSNRFSNN